MNKGHINQKLKDFIVEQLGIRIEWCINLCSSEGTRGRWQKCKTIQLDIDYATNYTLAHEAGHVICGESCCWEHAEFEAHGAAKALLKQFGIWRGQAEEAMSYYSGINPRKDCARYKK